MSEQGSEGRRAAPDVLRTVGEALYGPQWQTSLARELHLDQRHLRAMLAGTRNVPPGIWNELRSLVTAKQHALARALAALGGGRS